MLLMQRWVVAKLLTAVKTPSIGGGLKLTTKNPPQRVFLFRGLLQQVHNGFDGVEKHNRQKSTHRQSNNPGNKDVADHT